MGKNYKNLLLQLCMTGLMASGGSASAQTSINLAGSGNRVETVADLDVTNGFTIEYDVNMNSLQDYNGLVTKGCANVGAPLDVYINSGGGMTVFYGNCSITGGGNPAFTFSAGTWYHISHTYDPAAGQGLLYVDGALVMTWSVGAGVGNGTVPVMIGNRADNVTDADAKFDNVRVWSGVRSASDIFAYKDVCLTGTEAGLEILYNMEEGTGTVLHDLATGNGSQDGTVIGSITWDAGVSCTPPAGAALNFDGANDYVPAGNILTASYTKEAWIYVNADVSYNNLISGGDNDGSHAFGIPGMVLSGGHNGSWNTVSDNTALNLNQWYHVAITYDSLSQTMKLYKNGVLVSQATGVGNYTNGNMVRIGAFNDAQNVFEGSMDETRIWNYARSQCQISSSMGCELTGAQPGLLLYYQFNEGVAGTGNSTVATATDLSGNANNGTLTNFALAGDTSNWIAPGAIASGISCGAAITGPVISINTATVCAGSAATLTASGATTYTWSTTETSVSISPSPSVTTTYTVTGTSAGGCIGTGTSTLTVTALPNLSVTGASAICSGYSTALTASGADTYVWANGPSAATNTVSPVTNTTFTVTGTDVSTGCSDTAYQVVTVHQASASSQTITLCAGQSLAVGTSTYHAGGTYTDVLATAEGCDSTVTTNLTVLPAMASSQSFSLCAGKSVTVGINTYSTSGTYVDVLPAVNGCDSTVTTSLSVHGMIDVSISSNGAVLTAQAAGASYQWLDCNNSNGVIAGQTGQSYMATLNGIYSVIVAENACSDTSACVTVLATGIAQPSGTHSVSVFPNPNAGTFTIRASGEGAYSIVNEWGQAVSSIRLDSANNYTVTIDHLDNGIYFITGAGGSVLKQKIVITR